MAKLKRHANFHLNESEEHIIDESMTMTDMSVPFETFYDFIKNNHQYMQQGTIDHLKEAFKHLDQAWEGEAKAHGVNFTPFGKVFSSDKGEEIEIGLDWMTDEAGDLEAGKDVDPELTKFMKDNNVLFVRSNGDQGGGWPEYVFKGKREDLQKFVDKFYGGEDVEVYEL